MNKLMMRLIHVGLLAVLAMLMGSVAHAAPNEGVCDDLKSFGNGLHGLCVAFCEAQDCTATLDLSTGELSFPKNCRSSSERTLAKFKARAGDDGPPMPCVNETGGCACWTEAEIDLVADKVTQGCENPTYYTILVGLDETEGGQEVAGTKTEDGLLQCFYQERSPAPGIIRFFDIGMEQHDICDQSVINECISRGFFMDMESSILFEMESGASSTATPTTMPTATPTAAPTPTPTAAPICVATGGRCQTATDCCIGECFSKKCKDW